MDMLKDVALDKISDLAEAKQLILRLFNIVEDLNFNIVELRKENQRLKDEISRLKGEHGRPDIKPQSPQNRDVSSQKERRESKKRNKRKKNGRIQITREETISEIKEELPGDVQFKGYEEVVVQDIVISPDNVKFKKIKYYSPSQKKIYTAEVPRGYEGGYGPGIKSLVLCLYYQDNVSEKKILSFLEDHGVLISSGQLSNLLIHKHEEFHQEKAKVQKEGIKSSEHQHIDDTGMRVKGKNQYCQILCNLFYTIYHTTDKKDRLSILKTLMGEEEVKFIFNEEAYKLMSYWGVSDKAFGLMRSKISQGTEMSFEELEKCLQESGIPDRHRKVALEASGIAWYHWQDSYPIVASLVCDEAKQFFDVVKKMVACWVHDGRHYKKLIPSIKHHQDLTENFIRSYWAYYRKLLAYKTGTGTAVDLSQEFDELFSTRTGYIALDERIELTKRKKARLLVVLQDPSCPLNNNPAELEARQVAKKRDVSYGCQSEIGKRAWNTFMSLSSTTRKLGLSFYKYLYNRISGDGSIPNLGELIRQRSAAILPSG